MFWFASRIQNVCDRPIDTFLLSRHIHAHEDRLGWERRLICHSFRHAFDIHLYEDGTDLLTIKALLGHKSLHSTTIYVHLAGGIRGAVSPFDRMAGVFSMSDYKIRQIFELSYEDYCAQKQYQSDVQRKAAHDIINCKSRKLGVNISQCPDCGDMEFHNNSCRNRNCPDCQAVLKEIWVDKRRAEVIDSPYIHVVFTLPHELNLLIYCNQKLLYGLLHRCCAETLLELSADKKRLGATPGIIQVFHTWNKELAYHVHMHCIVSSGGHF